MLSVQFGGPFDDQYKMADPFSAARCISWLTLIRCWPQYSSDSVAAREVKGPFRRARERRPARSGRFPVRPIRIQPRPIRSDRGWHRQRDRPPSALYLFRCQDGAAHPQARAEARAAALGAPRDSIRKSPEARWSSHPDAARAPCAPVLLRSRQGLLSSKSARRALRNG